MKASACLGIAAGFLLLFGPSKSQAQLDSSLYELLSVKQGLSSNAVLAIHQDWEGYLWFATDNGLNKYDGYTFTVYQPDPKDIKNSLSTNRVTSILEDRNGDLWLSTPSGGVNHFNRRTATFTSYLIDSTNRYDQDYCFMMTADRADQFWLASLGGLYRFDPVSKQFTLFKHAPDQYEKSQLYREIQSVYVDKKGIIWVGTVIGLYRFDPVTRQFTHYLYDAELMKKQGANLVPCILEDQAGELWVTGETGLRRFDRATGKFSVSKYDNPIIGNYANHLYQDREGNLWIGSGRGVCSLHPQTGKAVTFIKYSDDFQPYYPPRGILQDRAGSFWFATWSGVRKYDVQASRFPSFRFPDSLRGPELENQVLSISEDAERVWPQ